MSVITLKYDNKLEQSDITVAVTALSPEDGEGITNPTDADQTKIYGVLTPIVSICGISFSWNEISRFTLYNDSKLPYVELTINDTRHVMASVNNPTNDNEVRIQILPPYEDTYKKINLTFYIDSISVNENKINISASYKVPELFKSQLKSFGKINSYDLFDKIAKECKLGFATNCEPNKDDERFVYCDNISYIDLMSREIENSSNKNQIFDYWIDLWNNINFVDITSRYNEKDEDEDMLIWSYIGLGNDITSNDEGSKPQQTLAMISNHHEVRGELHTKQYKVISNTGVNKRNGTDKVHTIYKNGNNIDILIEDGNVHNDIFTKYAYLGENIGEYEYLASSSYRDGFLDIMNKNNIEVVLNYPTIGLMRGSHVMFEWYENSPSQKILIENKGGDMDDGTDDQTAELSDETQLIRNKQLSGEYLILKTVLIYKQNKWVNVLTLTKPSSEIKTYNS